MQYTDVATMLRERNELADGWRGQAGVVCPRCGTEIVYRVTTQLGGAGVSLEVFQTCDVTSGVTTLNPKLAGDSLR